MTAVVTPATRNTGVIYGRQSKDKRTSIDQQIEIGRGVFADHGWTLTAVYRDGTSASRFATKAREDWARLLKDLQAARFGVLFLWEPSRGDRDLPSWVAMLATCRETGVRIYVHTHERLYDCRNARDWKALVDDGVTSSYESEQTSVRIKRNTDALAATGRPHGQIAYGYRRVRELDDSGRILDSRDELVPAEADVVREVARRLLAGESMRAIVRTLNARGSTSPTGKPWQSTTLRQVMLRDRNAGLRRHRGHVIGPGKWPPIYDEDTHARVVALLRDPVRTTGMSNKGANRVHLLSGIARCGRCGGAMRGTPGTVYRGKTIRPKYQCKDCLRVARGKEAVESVVVPVVIGRLSRPDAVAALASGNPGRAKELHDQITGAQARLNLAADDFADGALTGEQLRRVNGALLPKIESWQAELAACAPAPGVLALAGVDAAARWATASLDQQRAVIAALMDITILPARSGQRFDPSLVQIEWRTA